MSEQYDGPQMAQRIIRLEEKILMLKLKISGMQKIGDDMAALCPYCTHCIAWRNLHRDHGL